eukprot:5577418-Pyramimonas_sp.AAC.1
MRCARTSAATRSRRRLSGSRTQSRASSSRRRAAHLGSHMADGQMQRGGLSAPSLSGPFDRALAEASPRATRGRRSRATAAAGKHESTMAEQRQRARLKWNALQ